MQVGTSALATDQTMLNLTATHEQQSAERTLAPGAMELY